MNVENFIISSNCSFDSIQNRFYGYVLSDEAYHYKSNLPQNSKLFRNLRHNCGVFSCVFKEDSKVLIFTDPLSQYPIFYFHDGDNFCISNSFKVVAKFSKNEVNRDVVFDCFSYYSPTNNETLVKGCYTTKPFSYIEIDYSSGKPNFSIIEFELEDCHENYDQLLHRVASNFILRAKSILEHHKPVVHLTGGLDSRLALAAIMKASSSPQDYSVFCFGTEQNEDKLIFNHLCKKFSLYPGGMLINGINIDSVKKLQYASKSFNGLKYTNQQNFYFSWTPNHSEVTGYFSGGLLKGFGNYFSQGKFIPFSYTSKVSEIPKYVFNASAFRLYSEINNYRRNYISKENLLYISNRSKCHFGVHSVVNNTSFHSFDILYDPDLIHLFNACPYSIEEKNCGAIITDLIEVIAGTELAFFPLAGKTLPVYREISLRDNEDNCFIKCKLPKNCDDYVIKTNSSYQRVSEREVDVFYQDFNHLCSELKLPREIISFITSFIYDEERLSKVEKTVLYSLIGYLHYIYSDDDC
ncbi:hypothetical protein ACEUD2_05775 [Aeromonas veronii]